MLRITESIGRHLPWTPPRLEYVYLSRIATSLPAEREFGPTSLRTASKIRAGTATVGSLFAYFGINAEALATDMARHGLTPATVVGSTDELKAMLADHAIQAHIDARRREQHTLLERYLTQQRLLDDPACALVDIGWHGTIPMALTMAFPDAWKSTPLRAYYLGYWRGTDEFPPPRTLITGLLSDSRRARDLVEAAPHYVAFLLESVCRADHGTVVGYRETPAGDVVPVTAGSSPQHAAEQSAAISCASIRSGILAYVADQSEHDTAVPGQACRDRRRLQWRLLRLAFFPTRKEIAAVAGLIHSEGHIPAWSQSLVDVALPQPLLSPRRWLRGLASPWRAGYVKASGGMFFAAMYLLLESGLVAAPDFLRRLVQNLARRVAGLR